MPEETTGNASDQNTPNSDAADTTTLVTDARDSKQKPDGADAGEKGEGDSKETAKPVAPEKYELTLPDGSLLDESVLERTAEIAKKQGLSNEQAQELLNQKSVAVNEYVSALQARVESWKTEVQNDKELGGAHFAKSVETAKRAVERFGTPEFQQALRDSGLGNHPEVVRVFKRIGEAMEDDTLLTVRQPSKKEPVDMASKFYPTSSEEK